MTKSLYVPVSVNLADDPAIMSAGADAEHLYLRALMLAKRIGTDGFIHLGHLRRLVDGMTCLAHGTTELELAGRLVANGLWAEVDLGWQIVGWLGWNPSQADLADKKAAQAERQRRHRERLADKTEPSRVTNASPDEQPHASVTRLSEVKRSEHEQTPKTDVDLTVDRSPLVAELFDLWRTECEHPRAQLDPKRRRRLTWAIANYDQADIADAIRGAARSPFHQGDNDRHRKYDELTLILRDAEHLEQFRDMFRNGPTVRIPPGLGALITATASEPMPQWERPEIDGNRKGTR